MALFLRLYLGHLLGDFALQPGSLVLAKRAGLRGQIVHALIVTACTALVLLDQLETTWPAVAIAGAAHLAIERVSIPARSGGSRSGLVVLFLDQTLHVLSLTLISLGFTRPVAPGIATIPLSLTQLAVVDGVAAVALMGAIVAFELHNSAMPVPGRENLVLGFDLTRAYGMLERGAALLVAVLSPYPVAGMVAFAPRIAYALASAPAQKARHLLEAAAGLILCVAAWICIAFLAAYE